MARIGWLWTLCALLVALCWMPSHAHAQGGLEERRDDAKKLANSAFDLLNDGLYQDAIELFLKADKRFHSPVFILFAAEAEEKRGRLVEARRYLQQILDETFPDFAPDSFRKAQVKAQGRASQLDEKIPRATFSVEGAQGGDPEVTVDGKLIASLTTPVQLNPGKHEANARTADGRTASKSFQLAEGDDTRVELILTGSVGVGADEPDPLPDVQGEHVESGGRSYVWPAVAFGVGAVGIVMGAAAGGVFLGKQSDLKTACEEDGDGDPQTCPDGDEIDSVSTLGNVATAGWVIAGIGVAAGVVLLFVPLGEESDDDDPAAALRIGPTGFSIEGRF
jgi:hypothetical protein